MFPNGGGGTTGTGLPDAQAELRDSMTILEEGSEETPVESKPPVVGENEEVEEEIHSEDEPEVVEETDEERETREAAEAAEAAEDKKVQPITSHRRPTVKDITTKFPEFFKTFPDMKHVLFREQEYAQVFPTVDDAKEAGQAAQDFNNFRTLVTSGKPADFEGFLQGVNEAKGLQSMAANFLPSLYKTNRDLYFQATQPIAASLIQNAYRQGMNGNENLKNAALVLAQFAFGDVGYATGEKELETLKPEIKEESPVDKERQEFYRERYQGVQQYVGGEGYKRLRAEIVRGFDPNNAFPQYTRDLLVKQVIDEIGDTLQKDARHIGTMNSLWKKANAAGYAGDWKDRLLTTYLSGARAVMPAIRAKVRKAAMSDVADSTQTRTERAGKSADRREVGGAGTGPSASGPAVKGQVPAAKEIDWSKTSDLDFLNDKITLKR